MTKDPRQLPMPLTYARIILRELGSSPELRARLLAGTQINEAALVDPAAEARLADLLTIFDNASSFCEPGWTLDLSFDLAAQGALGFAMACAPTLADSFDVMARYGHVRAPWFRLEVFREASQWGVKIRRQFPVALHLDVAMVESVLLSGQNLVESVLGRSIDEAVMSFDYPAPAWRERYLTCFSGRVVFDSDYAGFSMPDVWRESLCPLADAGMYQAAISRLEMERRRLDSADFLSVRVAMLLAASGDAGLSLGAVAGSMNVSRRTLIRRLKEAGTAFSELLDEHHKQRATELLANPNFTATEVGYRLGYTEPANFTRAFKRWFGTTPGSYRRGRK
ncbi:MAG: helix-turn-helix domain-containing protein [Pseudomonadales bacterium]